MARPTKYTDKLADDICSSISKSSKGLRAICQSGNYPDPATIYRWLAENASFRDKYARAKELQAEILVEEIIEIADDTSNDTMIVGPEGGEREVANNEFINRSRLRVDARKWVASKIFPKKYGDRTAIDLDVSDNTVKLTREIIGKP